MPMSLETIELCPAAEPVASLIILHGLGADGTDFLPLCDELDLSAIGPCAACCRARRCAR